MDLLQALSKPFHPSHVSWKPGAVKGERALALAYADLRAYMTRLDEVCGSDWSVTYEPWGENRIICKLTITGITRSSTGESNSESERSEIGGTVAEAQAFKRAAAMFGLGRYLYTLPTIWVDFDPKTRQFTAQAKTKLTAMLVQHYRRANEDDIGPGPQDIFAANDETSDAPIKEPASLPDETGEEPTDEELSIINLWRGPMDAKEWAIRENYCRNIAHADNSFAASTKACGGYTTKIKGKVFLHFLRHNRSKVSA